MKLTKEEIARKLLHLFALLMPVGIFYGPRWSFHPLFMPALLFSIFFASAAVELLRFRVPWIQAAVFHVFGVMMRAEERHKISGWTWVIGAAFLCAVLFRNHPHISFMALSLFILGDAVAALVGIGVGRIRIGKKTLEGSLACFALCMVLFYAAFPLVPGLLDAWQGKAPAIIIWVTAFVITLFELLPLRIGRTLTINDNLAVPVIAGYVMIGLEKLIL